MKAFSLIELSIALIVVGVLIGGIVTGQSLLRASALRSVTADYSGYQSAVQTFRDKYFGLPGDISNATAFWGKDNTYCAAHSGAASTSGTCNGNGNGLLDAAGGAGQTGENFQFWRQLSLSGLISGNYTGIASTAHARGSVPDENVPASRLGAASFGIEGWPINYSGDAYRWNGLYRNTYMIGFAAASSPPEGNVFSPEEAWNIDTKFDDGRPASGQFRTFRKSTRPNCTTTDVESTTEYNGTYSGIACSLVIISGF